VLISGEQDNFIHSGTGAPSLGISVPTCHLSQPILWVCGCFASATVGGWCVPPALVNLCCNTHRSPISLSAVGPTEPQAAHTREMSRPNAFVRSQSIVTSALLRRLNWEYVSKPFHTKPAPRPHKGPTLGTSMTARSLPT
jgi:hypothetical protein